MRKTFLQSSFQKLKDYDKPQAEISLHYTDKGVQNLPGLEKFKNLTELDISNNFLQWQVPEILSLKYLKRLVLSGNCISELWQVPDTLEYLNLSNNNITSLDITIPSLHRLQTLDITANNIISIAPLASLKFLKHLYAAYNSIRTLDGIDNFQTITEVDVSENSIMNYQDLQILQNCSTLVVINLQGNPIEKQIVISELIAPDPLQVLSIPGEFKLAQNGIFYKSFARLREIQSSRFKHILKKKRSIEDAEFLASPEWPQSKGNNTIDSPQNINLSRIQEEIMQNSKEVTLMKEDIIAAIQEVNQSPSYISISSSCSDEEIDMIEQPVKVMKTPPLKLKNEFSITRLQLDKISQPSPGKHGYSTKPESYIETLFEDLISYFKLETSASVSAEKYEVAANLIKQKEDERKILMIEKQNLNDQIGQLNQTVERLSMIINDFQGFQVQNNCNIEYKNQLRSQGLQIDQLQQKLLEQSNIINLQDQQFRKQVEQVNRESEAMNAELIKSQQALIQKIRELEERNTDFIQNTRYDHSMRSRSVLRQTYSPINDSSISAAIDLSYCQRVQESESRFIINKKVRNYIDRLKDKISQMHTKMKRLREQKNRYKNNVNICTEIISSLSTN